MSPVLFSGHVYTVKLCFIGLETFSRNKVSHRIVPSYMILPISHDGARDKLTLRRNQMDMINDFFK